MDYLLKRRPTFTRLLDERCTPLIGTAKLNGVDPQLWLTDVLARIADHPARHLADLLP